MQKVCEDGERSKKLNKFDVYMMLVSGILFADVIASNTSAGVSSITWWLILGVLYMCPSGLIISELTSAYPKQGGIYIWIREGMGIRWAARASWISFACGFFIPVSSFIMCSNILSNIFFPRAGFILRVIIAVIFLWTMIYVASKPMSESRVIVNIAGIIKLTIFILSFVCGMIYICKGNHIANNINISNLKPTLNQGIIYLPIIIFSMTGMELASASAEDAEEPGKNLPKFIILIALTAIILNILAVIGTLAVIPLNSLNIVTGTIDVFTKTFESPSFYSIVGVPFIFSIFSQCLTWIIGGTRGISESAKEGEFPSVLGIETKAGLPIGAMSSIGIGSTILLVAYALLADSEADLFFSLLSCGVFMSLLPYVFMLISYQKLKKTLLKNHSGFKAPFGIALSWSSLFILIITMLLLIYIPGHGWSQNIVTTASGTLIMLISGEIVIHHNKKKR